MKSERIGASTICLIMLISWSFATVIEDQTEYPVRYGIETLPGQLQVMHGILETQLIPMDLTRMQFLDTGMPDVRAQISLSMQGPRLVGW